MIDDPTEEAPCFAFETGKVAALILFLAALTLLVLSAFDLFWPIAE
jgi:hypothetical protein